MIFENFYFSFSTFTSKIATGYSILKFPKTSGLTSPIIPISFPFKTIAAALPEIKVSSSISFSSKVFPIFLKKASKLLFISTNPALECEIPADSFRR